MKSFHFALYPMVFRSYLWSDRILEEEDAVLHTIYVRTVYEECMQCYGTMVGSLVTFKA